MSVPSASSIMSPAESSVIVEPVMALPFTSREPPNCGVVSSTMSDKAASDIANPEMLEQVRSAIGGTADGVLSDMAADTTGHRTTDHLRTTALLEVALDFSLDVLTPNGFFLAKCFRGGAEKSVLDVMRRNFKTVRHVKPAASRAESVESYVLATGFHGHGRADDIVVDTVAGRRDPSGRLID